MIRKIARPMVASVYIADGADSLINTKDHAENAEVLLKRVRAFLPRSYARQLPDDPELIVRVVGAKKVLAGTALAFGLFPRLSAATLALTAIPTMVSRHAFWETQDPAERSARRSGFLTNTALLGGLLITSMDTAGKPGLRWRANKAAATANKKVQAALPTKSETEKFGESARDWFEETSDKVSEYANRAQDYVNDNKDDWFDLVTDTAEDWLSTAKKNTKAARKGVVKAAAKAQDRADSALARAEKKSGNAAKKAEKTYSKLQSQADKALNKAQKKLGDSLNF